MPTSSGSGPIFSATHIWVTALICGAVVAGLSVVAWSRLPRRSWIDVAALAGLTCASVALWRLSANMPQLNSDGLSGFSANDWAAPALTYLLLGVYADLRPPADRGRYRQVRAAAFLVSLVVNVVTI